MRGTENGSTEPTKQQQYNIRYEVYIEYTCADHALHVNLLGFGLYSKPSSFCKHSNRGREGSKWNVVRNAYAFIDLMTNFKVSWLSSIEQWIIVIVGIHLHLQAKFSSIWPRLIKRERERLECSLSTLCRFCAVLTLKKTLFVITLWLLHSFKELCARSVNLNVISPWRVRLKGLCPVIYYLGCWEFQWH